MSMGIIKKERKDIKKLDKFCVECGRKLHRKRYNNVLESFSAFKKRKFCNRKCMSKNFKFRWSSEVLPQQGNVRARMLIKKKCCELCNNINSLDIHHKDRNKLNNNTDNLQVLCRSCHTKEHRNNDDWNKQNHINRKKYKNGRFI